MATKKRKFIVMALNVTEKDNPYIEDSWVESSTKVPTNVGVYDDQSAYKVLAVEIEDYRTNKSTAQVLYVGAVELYD
jgi:hypothetical protein